MGGTGLPIPDRLEQQNHQAHRRALREGIIRRLQKRFRLVQKQARKMKRFFIQLLDI